MRLAAIYNCIACAEALRGSSVLSASLNNRQLVEAQHTRKVAMPAEWLLRNRIVCTERVALLRIPTDTYSPQFGVIMRSDEGRQADGLQNGPILLGIPLYSPRGGVLGC